MQNAHLGLGGTVAVNAGGRPSLSLAIARSIGSGASISGSIGSASGFFVGLRFT
jgi:hypothetical protein